MPVYLAEFDLPDKFAKAKRFCPCPCCSPEHGKFGRCLVAWFQEEKVIRIIGPHCFASLNPEAHAQARRTFEIEQSRKRNTDFLLANVPKLPGVVEVIRRAIVVANAMEAFHAELHDKLGLVNMNLWPYVRREGALSINVETQVFREDRGEQLRTHTEHGTQVAFTLAGYRMLDPALGPLSKSLEAILGRIEPYQFGEQAQASVEAMDDNERMKAADTLSRNLRRAWEKIKCIEDIRQFVQRASINTLRSWGTHPGCPIPYNYSRDGQRFSFGRSDYEHVSVQIPPAIEHHIGEIEFWTELERLGRS